MNTFVAEFDPVCWFGAKHPWIWPKLNYWKLISNLGQFTVCNQDNHVSHVHYQRCTKQSWKVVIIIKKEKGESDEKERWVGGGNKLFHVLLSFQFFIYYCCLLSFHLKKLERPDHYWICKREKKHNCFVKTSFLPLVFCLISF